MNGIDLCVDEIVYMHEISKVFFFFTLTLLLVPHHGMATFLHLRSINDIKQAKNMEH